MIGVYEGLALADKAGLDHNVLLELVKVSAGNSWVVEHWGMVSSWKENYREGGTMDLIYKDIDLTLKLAEKLKVPLYLASLAKQMGRY